MERLVITAQDPILDIPALPLEYTADASAPAALLPGGPLAERMDAYEAQIIRDSYQRCGTTVAVARELGISQACLLYTSFSLYSNLENATMYEIFRQVCL